MLLRSGVRVERPTEVEYIAPLAALKAALTPLLGSISVERMRAANYLVDRDADKRTPAEAARSLLQGNAPVN